MPRRPLPPGHIPPRVRPLIPLIGEGRSNGEIAAALTLSSHTVENYVSELLHLTGARNRTQLAVWISTGQFSIE